MAKQISLEDIAHDLGHGNVAGIVPELIYGYHEDVLTWPTEPTPTVVGEVTTPLSMAAAGALVGDLIMKDGTKAFKMEFTDDAGQLSIGTVGENDGISCEMTLDIVKAKIQKTILGFQNAAANRKMFFIVTDENGTGYLMGNKKRGASMVSGGDGAKTGTTGSDRNQLSLQFKFKCAKALVYEGDTEDILITAV